jgi:hypothetical protein
MRVEVQNLLLSNNRLPGKKAARGLVKILQACFVRGEEYEGVTV